MTPVFSAAFARAFLGEPWLGLEKCAAVVAIAGVLLQSRAGVRNSRLVEGRTTRPTSRRFDGDRVAGRHHALGLVWALASAVTAASAHVLVRLLGTVATGAGPSPAEEASQPSPPGTFTGGRGVAAVAAGDARAAQVVKVDWPIPMLYQALGQVVMSGPMLFALRGARPRLDLSPTSWLLTFCIGVIGFLSQICMTRGMQNAKSASAGLMRLWGLPCSFAMQAAMTTDPVRPLAVVGALVMSAAMGLVACAGRQKAATASSKGVEITAYAPVALRADEECPGELPEG